jgi:thymidylate synthase (FAD)
MRVDVLDHGYVLLVQCMGDDLTPVNAARVSFDKRGSRDVDGELAPRDRRLLRYLAEHDHTSPFRHAVLTFEIYAPLMVARQWWKYRIGGSHTEPLEAWNESSRRYISEEPVFYCPSEWRSAPASRKQGSGAALDGPAAAYASALLSERIREGLEAYQWALQAGIAPEQARLFLPAYAMYVRWWWTSSLQGVVHFLRQRLADDAQWEIRQYALAVDAITRSAFPVCMDELIREEGA